MPSRLLYPSHRVTHAASPKHINMDRIPNAITAIETKFPSWHHPNPVQWCESTLTCFECVRFHQKLHFLGVLHFFKIDSLLMIQTSTHCTCFFLSRLPLYLLLILLLHLIPPNRGSNSIILSPCSGVLELVSLSIFESSIVRLYFGISK